MGRPKNKKSVTGGIRRATERTKRVEDHKINQEGVENERKVTLEDAEKIAAEIEAAEDATEDGEVATTEAGEESGEDADGHAEAEDESSQEEAEESEESGDKFQDLIGSEAEDEARFRGVDTQRGPSKEPLRRGADEKKRVQAEIDALDKVRNSELQGHLGEMKGTGDSLQAVVARMRNRK